MRHDFLVFVPLEDQKSSVSYSMYAYGVKTEAPRQTDDEKSLCLSFDGNHIAVLLYYFSGFERAYVVTGWDSESSEKKSSLPGVDGDLYILFTAIGREYKSLKRLIAIITKYSEEGVFKMPQSFWFRLCALIQGRKARKSNVLHLLHLTKEENEFYGRENDLCTEISK